MISRLINTPTRMAFEIRTEGEGRPWFDAMGFEWVHNDAGQWIRVSPPGMETIETTWNKFRRAVLPLNVHPTQLIETRRAFYAGWQAAIVAAEYIGNDAVTEDAGVSWFESRRHEASLFAHDVAEGRA